MVGREFRLHPQEPASSWLQKERRGHHLLYAFIVVLGLLLSGSTLNAQTTFGSITGVVTDASGAVIPNATVAATLVASGLKTTTRSNALGIYNLANMRDGAYQITITASGFQQELLTDIQLLPRQLLREDIMLKVGAVTQETVVSAAPGVIDTDAVTISNTQTAQDIGTSSLVAGQGNLYNLWAVIPTFAQATVGTTPSFVGSRANDYGLTFDGVASDNGQLGSVGVNILSTTDWIQETKADYVNNSAQYGQIAQLQVVSKSGTNALHGAVYDYYSDAGLMSAKSFFATASPTGIKNYWGFDLGGPVYIPKVYNGKNKTFFFVDYQHQHSPALVNLVDTVPLQAWRTGDFSGLGLPVKNSLTGQTYANGMIPQTAISPVSLALQNLFYPLPNYGNTSVLTSGNYRLQEAMPPAIVKFPMIRLDQSLGAKDYIYASFLFLPENLTENNNSGLPTNNFIATYTREEKLYNFDYAHTFRANLLNEFKFGGGSDIIKFQPPFGSGLAFDQSFGVTGLASGVPANIPGYPTMTFSNGITGISQTYPYTRTVNATQHWSDTVSYFHGRHAFTFGADIGRYWPHSLAASTALFGSESFSPTYSGSNTSLAYADFLLGTPTTASIGYAPVASNPHRLSQAYFATDTWKATSRLTITLGMRYEYYGEWSDSNNLLAAFDQANSSIVVPAAALGGVSPLMPTSYIPIVTTAQAGVPKNMYNADPHEFAPRIGVAFRPFGDKTVFRAGYGIFYSDYQPLPSIASTPYNISVPAYTNTKPTPTVAFPNFFPLAGTSGPSTVSLPLALNPNLRMPYSQQWNFTIEHEMKGFGLRASVIGTDGRQMVYENNINSPVVDNNLFINKPRPWTKYPQIYEYFNGANHNYTALNLAVLRRFHHGLSVDSEFAWARDIGDDVAMPENPFCLACERGPEGGEPRLRWTNNAIYMLPVGRGQAFLPHIPKVLDGAIGGWQLEVMYFAGTGKFLTPTITIPDPTGTTYTTSSTPAQVTMRPDELSNPNISNRTIAQWYNIGLNTTGGAWATPPLGRFGNAAPGAVVGPGENVWHADFQKSIAFSDNPRAPRLRLDLFCLNIFNHPNFGNPAVNLSAPSTAGVITGIGGSGSGSFGSKPDVPRTVEVSARVEW